jgi:hypothetical protein
MKRMHNNQGSPLNMLESCTLHILTVRVYDTIVRETKPHFQPDIPKTITLFVPTPISAVVTQQVKTAVVLSDDLIRQSLDLA